MRDLNPHILTHKQTAMHTSTQNARAQGAAISYGQNLKQEKKPRKYLIYFALIRVRKASSHAVPH